MTPSIEAALRPIAAIKFADIEPGGADMARPKYAEIDPTELLVDESYQRNLSERSRELIRKLVRSWDWRAYKPPNVVRVGKEIHIIDGQHTAIAAASHPLVGKIPVLIIEADTAPDRAAAFIKLNRDRINITPTQLHHAAVKAGDEEALAIDAVCKKAGVRILKNPLGGQTPWRVGETLAVATIGRIVRLRKPTGARRVLEIAVAAGCAPVDAPTLRAIDAVLFDPQYAGVDPKDLAIVLRERANDIWVQAAKYAAEYKARQWVALATMLHRYAAKAKVLARGAAWTTDDDGRVRELVERGKGLTAIAAIMQKPYASVSAAMERLGLLRSQARGAA